MKQGKTIDEQLSQLKKRGLDIPDYQKAYRTLQNVNYYTITGYLFPFKDKDTGHYHPGTSIELAINRYYFDSEMRTILMSLISEQRKC